MQILSLLVEILKATWEWIYLLSPLKMSIIYEGERGVKFKKGKIDKTLESGIHFGYFLETIQKDKAVYCKGSIDYELDFWLKDLVPIKINIVFTYDVYNMGLFLTSSEESSYLLSDIIETSAKRVISNKDFKTFHNDQEAADLEILEMAQKSCDLAKLGVQIKLVRVNTIKVTSNVMQNTVCLSKIMGEAKIFVDQNYDFGAIAAIISNSMPTNNVGTQWVAEEEEEDLDE